MQKINNNGQNETGFVGQKCDFTTQDPEQYKITSKFRSLKGTNYLLLAYSICVISNCS